MADLTLQMDISSAWVEITAGLPMEDGGTYVVDVVNAAATPSSITPTPTPTTPPAR